MKTKKAMKKITNIGMAALVAMGMLGTSCNKVESQEMETPETPKDNIVTVTTTVGFAEADTKALALDYTAKTLTKTFKAGEQVVLRYLNEGGLEHTVSQPLTDEDISPDGKSAKLTFTLTNPMEYGMVNYRYPASMFLYGDINFEYFMAQNGTLDNVAKRDYASFTGILDGTNLPAWATLENQFAVVAFTLYESDGTTDITNTITGMTIKVGDTYTITPSTSLNKIYVAMMPTDNSEINITATDGTKNYTKTLTGKTYAANNFYQQGLKMELVKPDLLSGVFSVSATKKVKFSKGNLRYASGTWSFFNNQYDYYTSYSAKAWDKFGWSTTATTYGMNTSTDNSTYSGDFVDWGATMGTGWFTLTIDEGTYLFNTRSASTVSGTENGRYAKAKVNNVQGVILFPDTYTHPDGVTAPVGVNATDDTGWDGNNYSSADWAKMESAGCVFLPAAGNRNGSSVYEPGFYGCYWSATPNGTGSAYYVSFASNSLDPANSYNRSRGYSVRLVHEAE